MKFRVEGPTDVFWTSRNLITGQVFMYTGGLDFNLPVRERIETTYVSAWYQRCPLHIALINNKNDEVTELLKRLSSLANDA